MTRHLLERLLTAWIGDGTGRFAAAPGGQINLSYMPGDVELGDVNGDKILDLGVTNSDRDAVDIFLGDGKGGFNRAAGAPFTVSAAVEFNTRSLNLVDSTKTGNWTSSPRITAETASRHCSATGVEGSHPGPRRHSSRVMTTTLSPLAKSTAMGIWMLWL